MVKVNIYRKNAQQPPTNIPQTLDPAIRIMEKKYISLSTFLPFKQKKMEKSILFFLYTSSRNKKHFETKKKALLKFYCIQLILRHTDFNFESSLILDYIQFYPIDKMY